MKVTLLIISPHALESECYVLTADSLMEDFKVISGYEICILRFTDIKGFNWVKMLIENRDTMYKYKTIEASDEQLEILKKFDSMPNAVKEKVLANL